MNQIARMQVLPMSSLIRIRIRGSSTPRGLAGVRRMTFAPVLIVSWQHSPSRVRLLATGRLDALMNVDYALHHENNHIA
ncbi:MAG: hypothetical protein OXU19_04415 [bacterium]|nr:hypothetical protein [bacterium]MDE0240481.1 hypothetical protein [bacterium]MDE0417819.1 hypothetical protein [bacterium]